MSAQATGAGARDADVIVISDDEAPHERGTPPKRQRTDTPAGRPLADGLGFKLLRIKPPPDCPVDIELEVTNRNAVGMSTVFENFYHNIKWVIMSNYMTDMGFVLQQLPGLRSVPKVFIFNHAPYEQLVSSGLNIGAVLRRQGITNMEVHCPPLPREYGTHHSKFFIIVYDDRVRVCVSTANNIELDWHHMTQGVWYQDFPKKASASAPESDFESSLIQYLKATRWTGGHVPGQGTVTPDMLRRFDFSIARVALAASVPGTFTTASNAAYKWGHMRIRRLLQGEQFSQDFDRSQLVWQFSSLSSVYNSNVKNQAARRKWVEELCASFNAGTVAGSSTRALERGGDPHFVWASRSEVCGSIVGERAGGAMPTTRENAVDKMNSVLFDCRRRWGAPPCTPHPEGRRHVMPHFKSYVRHKDQRIAWLYLGSSNLSKAAWGEQQTNGSQLSIKSYELGVIFLPSRLRVDGGEPMRMVTTQAPEAAAQGHRAGVIDTAAGRVLALPLPYPLPPVPYLPGEEPWYWKERE